MNINEPPSAAIFWQNYQAEGPGAVALGFFDGLHLGHLALLRETLREAASAGVRPLVFTLSSHPSALIAPEHKEKLLCSFEEKARMLTDMGFTCIYADFTPELAALAAEDFINSILADKLRASVVLAGADHRFGAGGRGNAQMLSELGPRLGFAVKIIEPVRYEGGSISSSRIRALISRGRMEEVPMLLGRYCSWQGTVVHGRKVGRTLGIPTANIEILPEKLCPPKGVFAARCDLFPPAGVSPSKNLRAIPGMAYWGNRPTFDNGREVLEVCLLTEPGYFQEDELYGWEIKAELCAMLRGEQTFASEKDFRAQVAVDKERAFRCIRDMASH
ncbi:riboflavin biosynthesis protein RibF [bacterium]|nr:riboflavin biosynthesis protein RibF [bacterium]